MSSHAFLKTATAALARRTWCRLKGKVKKVYFAALRAGDQNDWTPLMKVWENRFEQFTDSTQ
jgi:hypothetical protein